MANSKRRKSIAGWVVRGLFALIAIGILLAVVAWWRWNSTPQYWDEAQAFLGDAENNPRVQAIATSVQQRVLAATNEHDMTLGRNHYVTPVTAQEALDAITVAAIQGADEAARSGIASDGTRWLVLDLREANAWLAVRLEKALANQNDRLPSGIGKPIVAIQDGKLVVAFKADQINQVVSAVLDARMTQDGQLHLRLLAVRGGELELPVNFLVNQLRDGIGGQKPPAEVVAWLQRALDGFKVDPRHNFDGKDVRLTGLEARGSVIELNYRTDRAAE